MRRQNTLENTQMKETLNTSEIADRLFRDENAGFTYAGARALAEYLDTDENADAEFDRVSIRCDFSEYDSALACAIEYGWNHEADLLDSDDNIRPDDEIEEENQERALKWLQDRTQVIEFDGGIIVAQF
jgi:hypothetical protein